MNIPASGWKNKGGTEGRYCACGSWKNHWVNCSRKDWPTECSVSGCSNAATYGLHVFNPNVAGERIVPGCASCNRLSGEFDLKGGVTVIPANKQHTCQQ